MLDKLIKLSHQTIKMNVYKGVGKRQVGSGIWTTIQRGFRPLLSTIAKTIKPHAIAAGKRALGVGASVAMDALSGTMNKKQIKQVLKDEAMKLRDEAKQKVSSLKRKYLDSNQQEGSGIPHKRRRKSVPKKNKSKKNKAKKMAKKVYKRKACKKSKCKGQKPKRKHYKRRAASKTKKGRVTKRKRRTVSRKAVKDIFG